ncbi:hypothetical protein P3T76_010028 [Phytophthora citrophthora]|uniref:Uncharacterized protein n=1 Tax=Phytophthora citrophthora TaxID=4793 RepID=A0AAD9LH89_9STRA|nr:hypothetical protein P3T76_010028 [Phytophthora citrophthora]
MDSFVVRNGGVGSKNGREDPGSFEQQQATEISKKLAQLRRAASDMYPAARELDGYFTSRLSETEKANFDLLK